jgi:hypothetical protein
MVHDNGAHMHEHTARTSLFLPRAMRHVVVLAFIALFVGCPDGGPVEDAGATDATCESFCALEAECGLRDVDTCTASSCDGETRKPSSSDACIADAIDCGEVVLCTCGESCAKVETCTGSADPACVSTCETLSAQTPEQKYVENRCIIESPCDDIAVCSN